MYEHYDQAVKGVFHYLNENRFSKTPKKNFSWATRKFRDFLSESKHDYSQEIAARWLFALEKQVSRKKFLFCRRALSLVDQVFTYGYVKDTHFSYGITRTRYHIPAHFKDSLRHTSSDEKKMVVPDQLSRWTELLVVGSFYSWRTMELPHLPS